VTHREFELQVDAYVDGELAPAEARELEEHLKECGDCARVHHTRIALSAAIGAQVPAFRAPDALRSRVRAGVWRGGGGAAGTSLGSRIAAPVVGRWLALAASLAVVAVGSWQFARSRTEGEALAAQVLASHVRSLMPGHLTDVGSSDQHTVKPWFNGKLDFSPPVYDFAGRGFPLLGGRLDYVGGRPVAALVYGRRQHLINVFLWPPPSPPSPSALAGGSSAGAATRTQQGYHLLHWATSAYAYWVVSDLGLPELQDFAGLLRAADSSAASAR
jgi:anti-sigma factor RsiW